jgi:hypothetical protein
MLRILVSLPYASRVKKEVTPTLHDVLPVGTLS